MQRVMVRYRVKADRVEDNERLVKAVYAQLDRERPAGIHYATFKLDDGVSFVHLALVDTADGNNPLTGLAAFREFSAGIAERCDENPVSTHWQEVGSYRMFGRDP